MTGIESPDAFARRVCQPLSYDRDAVVAEIAERDRMVRAEALRERAGELRGRAAGHLDPAQRKLVDALALATALEAAMAENERLRTELEMIRDAAADAIRDNEHVGFTVRTLHALRSIKLKGTR